MQRKRKSAPDAAPKVTIAGLKETGKQVRLVKLVRQGMNVGNRERHPSCSADRQVLNSSPLFQLLSPAGTS